VKNFRKKPHRSLRTILIVWFLLFSILPLGFVTAYSLHKFEKAINNELSQRLSGNAREISGILSDYQSGFQQKRDKYIRDPNLSYNLVMKDSLSLKQMATQWLKSDFSTSLTFFNREGRMLISVFKDEKGDIRSFQPVQEAVFLSDKYLNHLKLTKEMGLTEFGENQKMSLILISKVQNAAGRTSGYLEQILDLDASFLHKIKARMKLEVMVFRGDGQFVVGSHPDFNLFSKDFFKPVIFIAKDPFFDITLRGVPYGFLMYPIEWGETNFYIAPGASKGDAQAVLKNVNYAFISVVSAVILLLIITIIFTSSWVLKPLYELVEALQSFESQEQVITIPVKNDTEIGLLTESFNQMSLKISQARRDLKRKIDELESANKELRETQTKLVHSAKMISLGQLVAGVAHELNNPIGFIFSNMAHLRDYSQKLISLVETAEKKPADLAKKKEELEFDYIVKDLPKLILSCEDGAKRTKDIVLGLRNFSRLEEAKLKEIDIHEALDTTLQLLQGEIKGRIEVFRNYEPVPHIHCYASQINQVIMNILSNAVQAIDGPGKIWIATHSLKNAQSKEGRIQISIQDSGKGMSVTTLEKIFDPFFTTKEVGQGTGLGLSISYGIIQNHGGEIQVRSEVGVGTEFIIVLPIQPPTTPV
jgi:two-component system NtrC family sensor kinase